MPRSRLRERAQTAVTAILRPSLRVSSSPSFWMMRTQRGADVAEPGDADAQRCFERLVGLLTASP